MESVDKIEEFVDNSRFINGAGNCNCNENSIYENAGYGCGHIRDGIRHKGTGKLSSAGGEARGANRYLTEIFKSNCNGCYI